MKLTDIFTSFLKAQVIYRLTLFLKFITPFQPFPFTFLKFNLQYSISFKLIRAYHHLKDLNCDKVEFCSMDHQNLRQLQDHLLIYHDQPFKFSLTF